MIYILPIVPIGWGLLSGMSVTDGEYVGSVYNIAWRGLAALLILDTGQCEGLIAGMGGSSISHAFFVSIHLHRQTAETGGAVGDKSKLKE